MKFATFSRLTGLAALACISALTGCGFLNNSTTSSSSTPTAGNWSFVATSTVNNTQVSLIGGNLTVSGNAVSSTMHADLQCFDPTVAFSFGGTLQNKQITFTSAANANNQVVTVIATLTSATTMTGTYSVTSGGGCAADQGTIAAALVPSITGTWSGPIVGKGGPSVTLAMALTQGSTAASDGTFPLTGTLTFTNSSCSKSGTVSTSSYLAGSLVIIDATTLEADGVTQGTIAYTGARLNNAAAPTTMNGTYTVSAGYCAGDVDTPTFTKQ
jgi:hypothetical protein